MDLPMPQRITTLKATLLILMVWLLAISNAKAGLVITDTVTASDGREWAQVDLFYELSWNEINDVCPEGNCSPVAMLNGWSLDGWEWASRETVQNLFNAYTGQMGLDPTSFVELDQTWTADFFADFRPFLQTNVPRSIVAGWSSTSHILDTPFMQGLFGVAPHLQEEPPNPFTPNIGEADTSDEDSSQLPTLSASLLGAWFVRSTPVPLPSSAWLILLGLAGISRLRHTRCDSA